jgi:pyruvate dehydrogenase E2 component (dihydrolipoamide acetyltransferase)
MMKQHGIDIALLTGSGPSGAIVQRDVEAAIAAGAADAAPAAAPTPAAAPRQTQPSVTITAREGDTVIEFSRMRQVIADRLQLSKQTVPHFYLQTDVDVTHLMGRRAERNAVGGTKISVNDVIIQAAAQCLREYPNLNAHVSQSSLTVKADINVGMAVSVDEGLMVPVLGNADGMSLAEIADQSREAANNARRGISKSASPGTFTISNLGMFGVEVFPIINPPEAAILGVGDIRQEPKAIGAGIAIRSMMRLVLSADHRAVDGAYAARFLAQLKLDLESHNLSH